MAFAIRIRKLGYRNNDFNSLALENRVATESLVEFAKSPCVFCLHSRLNIEPRIPHPINVLLATKPRGDVLSTPNHAQRVPQKA